MKNPLSDYSFINSTVQIAHRLQFNSILFINSY